jgi:hypothetical protein
LKAELIYLQQPWSRRCSSPYTSQLMVDLQGAARVQHRKSDEDQPSRSRWATVDARISAYETVLVDDRSCVRLGQYI